MKLLICTFLVVLMTVSALADVCEYNYCVKDELHVCNKTIQDRIECNNRSGLFITYKKGTFYPSDHTCCIGWRIEQISDKNLYCVRNIRDSKRKCTSEEVKEYQFKFASKCKGHNFSCQ